MHLLGKAMDKNFWMEVREKDCYQKYREELFDLWKRYCENGPITALRYSDFKLFWTTGNRGIYETSYFARRVALDCSALLSLIYPEEETYFIRLMDQIFAICDEYTWCLPAHQGELEWNVTDRIDLFASETGFALSEICTLLENRLEPLIKKRIMAEIDRRIFKPFLATEEYSWWEHETHNWTAVCTGSVAGAFMLMRPDLAKDLIPRFNKAMECYLSGLKSDGVCIEGCGYWHYGFGFFTVYADMVKTFTKGEVDWFRNDKVKAVATFIQKMFLSESACVSFADSGRTLTYHLGLCHYLKDVYPDDVVVYDPKYSYNYDTCGRFCLQLRSAIWLNEDSYYNPTPDDRDAEYYADDAQWFIKRTRAYGFAAKGGHNAEHHNNNDVGSFIFAKNGRQVLMDIGSGIYSRQYFTQETRYDILECSSRGHSVPIVDGVLQFTGRAASSADTKYEDGIFSTDIAGAYRCHGLESIKRSFSFTDDTVRMTDDFVYSGEGAIVERIVTLYPPKLGNDTVTVEDVTIRFDPVTCDAVIGSEVRERKDECYFIEFKLKNGEKKFVCEIM